MVDRWASTACMTEMGRRSTEFGLGMGTRAVILAGVGIIRQIRQRFISLW